MEHEDPRLWSEVPWVDDQPRWSGRWEFSCDVRSYAPFFITARYGFTLSDEGGGGDTAIHAWLGRPSRPFIVYDWRI
jgi:hypothetical protein